jgi:subtilisin-like proprotein convertase family protein
MKKNIMKMLLGSVMTFALLIGGTNLAEAFNIAGPPANDIDTDPATSIFLNVAETGIITDLDLNINIDANYADDVDIFLVHNGITVHVYDAIGDNSGSYINATFDDEAAATYPVNNTVDGTFQSSPDLLSAFDGQDLSGVWELRLVDPGWPGDGTDLIGWSISGATAATVPTMNEWGMIIFITLAGLGSVYYLRRKRIA